MNVSYLGIDVSKRSLDLAGEDQHLGAFDNTPQGRRRLIGRIAQATADPTDSVLVAVEATGGYERAIVEDLGKAGLVVAVVQPACVRHFAKSLKLHAKTDAVDARLLARFAAATRPRAVQKQDPQALRLRALRDRREQIVEDRVREQNRLEACADPRIAAEIRRSIRRLSKQEHQLDQQIDQCLQSDGLKPRAEQLQRNKGVGSQVAATLLAHLPELGRTNRQQIAALAGLAPYACESGQYKGKRRIYGGRAAVRTALYMAALSAARWDPALRTFYQRLLAAGKLKKVAHIAVARKLLVRLNTQIATLLNQTQSHPAGTTTT